MLPAALRAAQREAAIQVYPDTDTNVHNTREIKELTQEWAKAGLHMGSLGAHTSLSFPHERHMA